MNKPIDECAFEMFDDMAGWAVDNRARLDELDRQHRAAEGLRRAQMQATLARAEARAVRRFAEDAQPLTDFGELA